MSGALLSLQPPRLPEPLQGRNAVVIRRETDGGLYAWRFVWGTYNSDDPLYVGATRADVQRHLQAEPPGVPVAIDG